MASHTQHSPRYTDKLPIKRTARCRTFDRKTGARPTGEHMAEQREKSRVMPSNNWCTSQKCHGDGVMLCQAELCCAVLYYSPLYCWLGPYWLMIRAVIGVFPHSSTGHSVPSLAASHPAA